MNIILETLSAIFLNRIFLACLIAWFIAQSSKVITALVKEKKFDLNKMFALGGMPSSHAATITALLFATYYEQGVTPLSIALFFIALIVIRDSVGVRQEVGKHARILNHHMKLLNRLTKAEREIEKLEEMVGHTFGEAIVGAVLGVIVATIVFLI